MGKVFKWIGIGGAVLFTLLAVVIIAVYINGTNTVYTTFSVEPLPVTVPTDPASVARGEHLVRAVTACVGCHGDNLQGGTVLHDEQIGILEAPNLTSGHGGIGKDYTTVDFVRAIRHGVGKDGRGLMIMPGKAFNNLSDEDLGAIIAYVRTVPPVDQETEPANIKAFGRILASVGAFGDVVSAKVIDHNAARPAKVEAGVTPRYGEYLVNIADCRACHGKDLSGGTSGEPGAPLAPNLTPGGDLKTWSEADFMTTLRTGKTPTRELSAYMPWKEFGQMTDDELKAIWAHLKSLAAVTK